MWTHLCKDERPIVRWLMDVELEDKIMTDLAVSGKGFEILDRKLAASLKRVVKGELSREIIQQEAIDGRQDRVLNGR